ncbi:MAG TPA: hypothetical protein VIF83_07970 [Gemmatimonadaceae bacterium]
MLIFPPSLPAVIIADADMRFAGEVVRPLAAGHGEEVMQLLHERRIAPARAEEILSVIFLVIADEKLSEAEAQVGRRKVADVSMGPERPSARRIAVQITESQLRTALGRTHAEVQENLRRFFPRGDAEFESTRATILRHREIGERVYNVLQGQQVGIDEHAAKTH